VGNDVPHHEREWLKVAAVLTKRVAAGTAHAVVRLDIVALGALVVVVMDRSTGTLRVECTYLSHVMPLLRDGRNINLN
jgi:hypothetical protein